MLSCRSCCSAIAFNGGTLIYTSYGAIAFAQQQGFGAVGRRLEGQILWWCKVYVDGGELSAGEKLVGIM